MDTYQKFKTENFFLFGGINSKASAYVNNPNEFRDLSNLNFINPGALTKRPGSTMYVGSTVTGSVLGGVEFQRLSGASSIIMAANTNLYQVTPPSTLQVVATNLLNGAVFNFVTFVDRLFSANGNNYFKFDGSNSYSFSLPPGATAQWGVTIAVGGSLINVANAATTGFVCGYGYLNDRGYIGPVSNGVTIFINGVTFNSIQYYGLTLDQLGYGITALQLWRTGANQVDLFGTTITPSNTTTVTDTGFPLGTSLSMNHLWFTLVPRYQEVFNNQLILAGFSGYPSRVYWSEIGEPEAIQPDYFGEFRTNDGDRITGLKFYNGALMVSKTKSLHRIVGDNPSNFAFQEITDQYGCLSNQSMVVFENLFWGLDKKGVLEYNGANVKIVSDPVEPFFRAMNVQAALDKALAVHYKQYNEVWFHIPINGATLNNTVLIYDYRAKAWSHYDGIQAACLFTAQGTQSTPTVFYGGYTGALFYMGASFMGDNGNAITCMAFTRFVAPSGQTTENLYRRFWGDVDPVLGVTQAIGIRLFSNYNATTVQATGVIYQSVFQTRLDFGISARTLAAQISHSSASLPFKLNAYTMESRFQRSV